jgi:hypothetical protein
VQDQNVLSAKRVLRLSLGVDRNGTRPEGEQDEQEKGRTKGYPSDSASDSHHELHR